MAMPYNPTKPISGSYGFLYDVDGNWLANVTRVEANVEIGMEEFPLAGTRWLQHKETSLSGSGSIGGFFVSSELRNKIAQVTNDNNASFVTELIAKIEDPSVGGTYRVRLKNVMFDSLPVINYELQTMIEEEYTFVFSGYEELDGIRPQ